MGSKVNPLALLVLLAACLIILFSNRRKAIGALLITAICIPLGQYIVIAGLHFYFLRILILAGLVRLFTRPEAGGFKLVTLDKLFVTWVFIGLVCEVIRGLRAETFGAVFDELGIYFFIRILSRDAGDVVAQLRVFAFIAIVLGACMAWEAVMHRNVFYTLGGVMQTPIVRDGRYRCEGSFRQPILAGTFGATLFPLLIGLWRNKDQKKWLVLAGIVGSIVITITSVSSGPLMTFLAAIMGFCLWPMRAKMYLFRRSIVVTLIGLTMVMNAPVWYLIARLGGEIGGGGWHRSWLIQQFVTHFTQWCFIGTSYTANWAPGGEVMPDNPNMMDITNQYVAQGIHGGLLCLVLFIIIIAACFKIVGRFVRGEREPAVRRILLWAFGVSLASHCAAFISVSYFDQIQVVWFWLLAMIAGIPVWAAQKNPVVNRPVVENANDSRAAEAVAR